MSRIQVGQDVFETTCDLIDVTSNSRPDVGWRYVDPAGHEHRWHVRDRESGDLVPARTYNPSWRYEVPTVREVIYAEGIDEDGYDRTDSHLECLQCGAHVRPGTCADAYQQHIPGLRRHFINGEPVTPDEFKARAEAVLKRDWR